MLLVAWYEESEAMLLLCYWISCVACLYWLLQEGQEKALCPECKHFRHLVLFLH